MKKRMIRNRRPVVAAVMFAVLLLITCGNNAGEKYSKAVERYRSGEKSALADMEKNLIRAVSRERLNGKGTYCENGLLFLRKDNKLKILYPREVSITLESADMDRIRSMDEDNLVLCDGLNCRIYDRGGSETASITGGEGKEEITAAGVHGGLVYFLRNKKMFTHDPVAGTNDPLTGDSFSPPYEKYFAGRMLFVGSRLCLILGAAGSYNLSVIDLEKNAPIVKNVSAASSKVYMDDRFVYYVSGTSGSWSLARRRIADGKPETIMSLKNLIDIEIVTGAAVLETKTGLSVANPDGKEIRVPFNYGLKGSAKGLALLEYDGDIYAVDAAVMYGMLKELQESVPGLFEGKE
ncbi:MAG: hypothetical protein CVV44_11915 [Spirochaetae bacterium HGW-Spirochaetae-1]|jgi:hypothetical protein|nr:MAG: hypothetical protein CVV44_11915 [Spirochaetae bacterium HGW-Spirochaetae-1]